MASLHICHSFRSTRLPSCSSQKNGTQTVLGATSEEVSSRDGEKTRADNPLDPFQPMAFLSTRGLTTLISLPFEPKTLVVFMATDAVRYQSLHLQRLYCPPSAASAAH
eukprot:NODE_4600_length_644_cov_64.020168_g3942_i0.p2 GENE.NODE_4600_length_644_cov_64.020168_g3942_i0~~NODE_4600_length_644_cov_64.020168_g3942_i0.p2  ORF type:complete len:108 (-),score=0.81 NODE_4600_length_644_cov_64.020168_g3942_i0:104-427(-)